MALLPTKLPEWYEVDTTTEEEKGWTPQTEDITVKDNGEPMEPEIYNPWDGSLISEPRCSTVEIRDLQPISPLQIGGGSFPEGLILPAQIAGTPIIPGSTIRGALLNRMKKLWKKEFSKEENQSEKEFWKSLIDTKTWQWQPRKIRFENISIQGLLEAFPLNPQQDWQIFYDDSSRKQLSIQWQVPAADPQNPIYLPAIRILLKDTESDPTKQENQKQWLETRLTEMLKKQGIGRGKASGFGRLATSIPEKGRWEIRLTGMKPCIQQHKTKDGQVTQQGKYRWSPQVLRACLRGYFTRLALSLFSKDDAQKLTNKIFGGTDEKGKSFLGKLILPSYLSQIVPSSEVVTGYANISAAKAYETWVIQVVNYSPKLEDLIEALLELGSYLGGLGPGWRRPPHSFRNDNVFRGNQFTVKSVKAKRPFTLTYERTKEQLENLLSRLNQIILELPETQGMIRRQEPQELGSIFSIWKGEQVNKWKTIVHGVCSSINKQCEWCGISQKDKEEISVFEDKQERPSGYTVRQYKDEDFCLITVFEPAMQTWLEAKQTKLEQAKQLREFDKIWGSEKIRSHSQNAS